MRFKRPNSARDAVVMIAVGGLITALVPIWLLDRARSWLRTRGRRGAVVSIERVALADGRSLAELMDEDRPVIITDLYEQLDLTTAPDISGLRSLAASDTFRVNRHRADAPYFLYVGDYGAVKLHTDTMAIGPFLDDLFAERDDAAEVSTYKLFAIDDLEGGIGRIIGEMAEQLETLGQRRADPAASGIWIGSRGVTTPLHHDAWTGLLFQPVGSKRVAMYAPLDRQNIYFSSPFKPTSRWTDLPARSAEADSATFPRMGRATRYEGRLEAGETLFIPPYWSHEVEALEPNISIPFRFATRPIDHLNPGFLRPAVEVFHRKYVTASRPAS